MANGDQHPMLRLWLDVKEGLVFIAGDPVLMRAIAYLTIAATTFLMIAALGPEFMSKVIGLPTEDIVYVVLPAGLASSPGSFWSIGCSRYLRETRSSILR